MADTLTVLKSAALQIAQHSDNLLNIFKTQIQVELSAMSSSNKVDQSVLDGHLDLVFRSVTAEWEIVENLTTLLSRHLNSVMPSILDISEFILVIRKIISYIVVCKSSFRDHEYQLPFQILTMMTVIKKAIRLYETTLNQSQISPVTGLTVAIDNNVTLDLSPVKDRAKFFEAQSQKHAKDSSILKHGKNQSGLPKLPEKPVDAKKPIPNVMENMMNTMKYGDQKFTSAFKDFREELDALIKADNQKNDALEKDTEEPVDLFQNLNADSPADDFTQMKHFSSVLTKHGDRASINMLTGDFTLIDHIKKFIPTKHYIDEELIIKPSTRIKTPQLGLAVQTSAKDETLPFSTYKPSNSPKPEPLLATVDATIKDSRLVSVTNDLATSTDELNIIEAYLEDGVAPELSEHISESSSLTSIKSSSRASTSTIVPAHETTRNTIQTVYETLEEIDSMLNSPSSAGENFSDSAIKKDLVRFPQPEDQNSSKIATHEILPKAEIHPMLSEKQSQNFSETSSESTKTAHKNQSDSLARETDIEAKKIDSETADTDKKLPKKVTSQAPLTLAEAAPLFSDEELSSLFESLSVESLVPVRMLPPAGQHKIGQHKPDFAEGSWIEEHATVMDVKHGERNDPGAMQSSLTEASFQTSLMQLELKKSPHFQLILIPTNAVFDTFYCELSQTLRMGRNNSQNVPLYKSFGSLVVSRNHAEIISRGAKVYIRDIGSNSGTFRNNARLSQPGESSPDVELMTGDYIQLGKNFVEEGNEIDECGRVESILN